MDFSLSNSIDEDFQSTSQSQQEIETSTESFRCISMLEMNGDDSVNSSDIFNFKNYFYHTPKKTHRKCSLCQKMYRVSTATNLFNNYQTSSSQDYDYEDPDSTMMSVNILNELRRDACVKKNPALDEIEDYLADPVAKTTVDVLGWWSENSNRFRRLSNMARDYLGQQTTSVASERLFSRAANIYTNKRNRMSSSTLKECLSLNSWDINILNLKEDFWK
ncbi:unnamed protein product [Gordionus sp. m RMFG-2023]